MTQTSSMGEKKETMITSFSSRHRDVGLWEAGGVEHETRIGSEEEDPYARDQLHGKYWRSMQLLKPMRLSKRKVPAPIDNSNFFQFILYTWLTPCIMRARKGIGIDDIPPLSKYEKAEDTSNRLQKIYNEDKKNNGGKGSIERAVFKYIKTRMIASTFCIVLSLAGAFCSPAFLISRLTGFSELVNPTVGYGVALTAGLVCTEFTRSLAFASYWGIGNRTGVRARSAVLSMVFWKIGRLRSLKDKSVGEIVNLLSNDGYRLAEMIMFLGIAIGAPVMLLITTVFTCLIFGWTALIGISIFVAFVPVQMVTGRLLARFRSRSVQVTDKRVRIMNEILNSVKLIKMYAWEASFAKSTGEIRKKEEELLRKSGTIQSLQIAIITIIPVIACSVTFIVHTTLGYELDATGAFTIIGVFNAMRFLLAILPQSVKALAEVKVSFKRIDELLDMEEIEEYFTEPKNKEVAIKLNKVTTAWDIVGKNDNEDKANGGSESSYVEVLFDIDYTVKRGELIGICGSVGSGKTSLVSSLLGSLRITKGNLEMKGTIAYVPQQAWIFHGTVRDNITFGMPFDQEKFKRVAYACSLEADFKILPDGELTEVGDRGLNLSGGQKQRISLARAVYSEREIVLLDDPLSAVDAHVGKHIFFECIRRALKGKTILFVTHQLQYLKDCDRVILIQDGKFSEQGTHQQLMTDGNFYKSMISKFNLEQKSDKPDAEDTELEIDIEAINKLKKRTAIEKEQLENENSTNGSDSSSDFSDVEIDDRDNKDQQKEKKAATDSDSVSTETDEKGKDKKTFELVKSEMQSSGSIGWSTYKAYIKAGGGYIIVLLGAFVYVTMLFGVNMNTWWLSFWINAGGKVLPCDNISTTASPSDGTTGSPFCEEVRDTNITTNPRLQFYQLVYVGIMLGTLCVGVFKAIAFTKVTLGASTSLHNQVFKAVFRSPMYFFDTTPSGRILNRFARDMDDIDVKLVLILDLFSQQALLIFFALITMVVVFPYFLIAIAVLLVVFGFIYTIFKPGVRELKRIDNTTRSPWFSHITSTISGLSTIHAYEKTDDMMKRFDDLMDNNARSYFCYLNASRWLSIRLDALTITVTACVALFVVFSAVYPEAMGETSASLAGLALTYAIQLTGLFQVCVRFSIETESLFTAVERINDYIVNCPHEVEPDKRVDVPQRSWPDKGSIKFKRAYMRYRDGLPSVLKNVSINIKPKEKIGIVGRTGSGKSSLGVALFRLSNIHSGKIVIDGIDISSIDLHALRSNVSIIPQEPVLFVGTIRYNLDPFANYTDEQIWKALELSHMKQSISQLPEKLESEVVENGENFSVGERQLMCMTRAILRNCKVIMLDEATAAIDSESDALVQETMKVAFADCTMLTIAHRLNTVLNSDKILVMDQGQVAEFDTPEKLLSNSDSHFSKMITAAASIQQHNNDDVKTPRHSTVASGQPQHGGHDNHAFVADDEEGDFAVL